MCVMTALVVASTAVSAIGAISAGNAQADAYRYQAQVADQNATAARQQAQTAALIQQEQAKRTMGATIAAYGASGIAMEGTPLDVLANSASQAERDRQQIIYKGEMQAAGYNNQAEMDRSSASNAQSQGYMKATGLLIGGAAKAYDQWPGGDGLDFVSSTPMRRL